MILRIKVKGMFGTIVQGHLEGHNQFWIVDKIINVIYNINSLVHHKRVDY